MVWGHPRKSLSSAAFPFQGDDELDRADIDATTQENFC